MGIIVVEMLVSMMSVVKILDGHVVKTIQGRSGRERVHKVLLLFIVPSIEGVINELMMLNFIKMIIIKGRHGLLLLLLLLLLHCKDCRHAMAVGLVVSHAVGRQRGGG